MVDHEQSVHHDVLVDRVRAHHPEMAARGPGVLDKFVGEGVANAESLGFTQQEDIYRFLVLPLVLSIAQRNSAMLNGLIVRVLDQTRWTPGHRLDFIYAQLVPRTPSAQTEVELAPLHTPARDLDDEPNQA